MDFDSRVHLSFVQCEHLRFLVLDPSQERVKEKVSYNLVAVGTVGDPPYLGLSMLPFSKQVPIFCWVDRQEFPVVG